MTLVRFNPWGEFDALHSELDRFFANGSRSVKQGNTANANQNASPYAKTGQTAGTFALSTDIYEDDAGFSIDIDMPGVKLEDVGIEVHEGVLNVTGQRKLAKDEAREGYRRVERSFGTFARSFRLPKHVNDGEITAKMVDGVLTLTLPKSEAAQPRKIEIAN